MFPLKQDRNTKYKNGCIADLLALPGYILILLTFFFSSRCLEPIIISSYFIQSLLLHKQYVYFTVCVEKFNFYSHKMSYRPFLSDNRTLQK